MVDRGVSQCRYEAVELKSAMREPSGQLCRAHRRLEIRGGTGPHCRAPGGHAQQYSSWPRKRAGYREPAATRSNVLDSLGKPGAVWLWSPEGTRFELRRNKIHADSCDPCAPGCWTIRPGRDCSCCNQQGIPSPLPGDRYRPGVCSSTRAVSQERLWVVWGVW